MSEPFLGEIRIVSFAFAPQGWAFCNGQTLPISQYQALFSLLGTFYGGDGRTTFQLPNFQGRIPVHQSNDYAIGQIGGEAAHTLIQEEIPVHSHLANAVAKTGVTTSPNGHVLAEAAANARYTSLYGLGSHYVQFDPRTVEIAGGSQAHENRQPSLVLNFVIALVGIFPSRN